MKKLFITIPLLLLMQVVAFGQVSIQPVIPSVGLIQKNQLWNVVVVNSSNTSYSCLLQLVLTDRVTGIEVLAASTGHFDIATGAKQLNVALLNPIQYNYMASGLDNHVQELLPVGNYTACYQLMSISLKSEKLAEECVQFDTEPLSPPLLIFPGDSSLLNSLPQQFSWTPPTPGGMFDRLRYELLITEVNEGQKAEEAVQNNIPFYNDGALFTNRMAYPASAAAFDKNKWYAWQITARDDKAYAAKSETWVFKITAGNIPVPGNVSYVVLSAGENGKGISNSVNGVLNIQFHSYDKDHIAEINVIAPGGKIVKRIKQKVIYGDNFFSIKIGNDLVKGKVYSIELKGLDGRKYVGLVRGAE